MDRQQLHLLHCFLKLCHHILLGVHIIYQSLKLLGDVALMIVQIILHWDEQIKTLNTE